MRVCLVCSEVPDVLRLLSLHSFPLAFVDLDLAFLLGRCELDSLYMLRMNKDTFRFPKERRLLVALVD